MKRNCGTEAMFSVEMILLFVAVRSKMGLLHPFSMEQGTDAELLSVIDRKYHFPKVTPILRISISLSRNQSLMPLAKRRKLN